MAVSHETFGERLDVLVNQREQFQSGEEYEATFGSFEKCNGADAGQEWFSDDHVCRLVFGPLDELQSRGMFCARAE
jgi:hypothetical protein